MEFLLISATAITTQKMKFSIKDFISKFDLEKSGKCVIDVVVVFLLLTLNIFRTIF